MNQEFGFIFLKPECFSFSFGQSWLKNFGPVNNRSFLHLALFSDVTSYLFNLYQIQKVFEKLSIQVFLMKTSQEGTQCSFEKLEQDSLNLFFPFILPGFISFDSISIFQCVKVICIKSSSRKIALGSQKKVCYNILKHLKSHRKKPEAPKLILTPFSKISFISYALWTFRVLLSTTDHNVSKAHYCLFLSKIMYYQF